MDFKPERKLVFDRHHLPDDLVDPLHELACEGHSGGNGFHVPWCVGKTDDNTFGWDGEGGYMNREDAAKLNEYLLANGAKEGEEVLILNEW